MSGYYDYILGLIPATLIGITLALTLVGLPVVSAVPAGATVAIGLMGHAMFVKGPVPETPSIDRDGRGAAGVDHAARTPTGNSGMSAQNAD
ncbi:hypothetical protein SAMN05192561_102286 [Halopenitus malekzadehii]|uniref:Uncharacterized protein n=1 Tax=Halopenitus malekzadehii TaxID=1267564 RepID=A0A1H6ILS2_9EURY|nr:hypothetical protein [Halopenitus malekzadehii]SEH47478.1 hypothetical protein SAMN05192561_102286 [Halopenitus malekzadehii]